ncbi:MAG: hypothetical protein J2P31_03330, partial [Blastocatellia bacterium]|nr:hypothetical protein [Blastocatellia bacterium]
EAEQCGIVSIDRAGNSLTIKLAEKARIEPDRLVRFLAENRAASFSPSGVLKVKLRLEDPDALQIFDSLDETLHQLR